LEMKEPKRGKITAPMETEIFVPADVFSQLKSAMDEYGISGISARASQELFKGTEETISYQAVRDPKEVTSDILDIARISSSLVKEEKRPVITLWDIKRAFYRRWPCIFPWCKE